MGLWKLVGGVVVVLSALAFLSWVDLTFNTLSRSMQNPSPTVTASAIQNITVASPPVQDVLAIRDACVNGTGDDCLLELGKQKVLGQAEDDFKK